MEFLTLKIVTPTGVLSEVICDSIHLIVSEDTNEEHGGGYGIRPGHTKALFSVEKGELTAYMQGKQVLCGKGSGGFATVENNTVTLVAEYFCAE